MKELIMIAMIAAIAWPIANIINAEKWAIAEMAERFENAKREGNRIDMRMQGEWDLHEEESGSLTN
jgi:hypothetical protein